jgi:hypothetical protein
MDHPTIRRVERTGYPKPTYNPQKPEFHLTLNQQKELTIAEFHDLRFGKKGR